MSKEDMNRVYVLTVGRACQGTVTERAITQGDCPSSPPVTDGGHKAAVVAYEPTVTAP